MDPVRTLKNRTNIIFFRLWLDLNWLLIAYSRFLQERLSISMDQETRRFITVATGARYRKLTWQLNPVHFLVLYFLRVFWL
jgi:hypothetical protein